MLTITPARLILVTVFCLTFTCSAIAAEIPTRPADVQRITIAELQALQASHEPVIMVDTRTPGQWQRATDKIPGAIRIDSQSALKKLKAEVPPNTEIVTYCT